MKALYRVLLFVFLQSIIIHGSVQKPAASNNLGSFLAGLNTPLASVSTAGSSTGGSSTEGSSTEGSSQGSSSDLASILSTKASVSVKHSTGEIALFLEKQASKPPISPAKAESNSLILQSFLQQQSNPMYQKAMMILNNKQLLGAYQRALSSIQLFFVNYVAKNLQHFHVKSSASTHSLTSFLGGLKNTTVVKSTAHGDELASLLSTLSTSTKKKVTLVQHPALVLPPNI